MRKRMGFIAGLLVICAGNSALAQRVVKEEPPDGSDAGGRSPARGRRQLSARKNQTRCRRQSYQGRWHEADRAHEQLRPAVGRKASWGRGRQWRTCAAKPKIVIPRASGVSSIQPASAIEPKRHGVLDHPLSRMIQPAAHVLIHFQTAKPSYARVWTITGPATAVAFPASSGARSRSIQAIARLFASSAPA